MDGFRFDLATALCRDERGVIMDSPPLIRDIAKDPVLSKVLPVTERPPTNPEFINRKVLSVVLPVQ